jgi:tetratricopeptide (TPR) repeat protein
VKCYDPAFRAEDAWTLSASAEHLALYHEASAASEAGRYKEKLEKFSRLLAEVPLHPGEEAILLDGMTAPAIFHNQLQFLPQSLQWGRRAHALLPESATLKGTYGSLLVLSGYTPVAGEDAAANVTTGLAMLMPLTAETQTLLDRTVSLYFISIAHQLLGRTAEAQAALDQAHKLGGDNQMLRRVIGQVRALREAAEAGGGMGTPAPALQQTPNQAPPWRLSVDGGAVDFNAPQPPMVVRVVGATIGLCGLGLGALCLMGIGRLFSGAAADAVVLVFIGVAGTLAVIFLTAGWNMLMLKPESGKSVLPRLAWYALAALFGVIGVGLCIKTLADGDLAGLVILVPFALFCGGCVLAGRLAGRRADATNNGESGSP